MRVALLRIARHAFEVVIKSGVKFGASVCASVCVCFFRGLDFCNLWAASLDPLGLGYKVN